MRFSDPPVAVCLYIYIIIFDTHLRHRLRGQIDVVEEQRPISLCACLAFKADDPVRPVMYIKNSRHAAHLGVNGDERITIIEARKALISDHCTLGCQAVAHHLGLLHVARPKITRL